MAVVLGNSTAPSSSWGLGVGNVIGSVFTLSTTPVVVQSLQAKITAASSSSAVRMGIYSIDTATGNATLVVASNERSVNGGSDTTPVFSLAAPVTLSPGSYFICIESTQAINLYFTGSGADEWQTSLTYGALPSTLTLTKAGPSYSLGLYANGVTATVQAGRSDATSGTWGCNPGDVLAIKFTLGSTTKISHLVASVASNASSSAARMAIYNADASGPTTLIAATEERAINGVYSTRPTFKLPSRLSLAAGTYALVFRSSQSVNLNYVYNGGYTRYSATSTPYANAWPSPFGTPTSNDTYSLGFYACLVTPAAFVGSVSPTSGSTSGGTSVTVTGQFLSESTGVTFGGTAATGVSVVDDATITCTTPAHSAGAVDVVAQNASGNGTITGGYTFTVPAVDYTDTASLSSAEAAASTDSEAIGESTTVTSVDATSTADSTNFADAVSLSPGGVVSTTDAADFGETSSFTSSGAVLAGDETLLNPGDTVSLTSGGLLAAADTADLSDAADPTTGSVLYGDDEESLGESAFLASSGTLSADEAFLFSDTVALGSWDVPSAADSGEFASTADLSSTLILLAVEGNNGAEALILLSDGTLDVLDQFTVAPPIDILYCEFFLRSPGSVVMYETLEITHPAFSRVYRVVRNKTDGLTATLEAQPDGSTPQASFDYYPLRIKPSTSRENLDFGLEIELGDLGEVLPAEVDAAIAYADNNRDPAPPAPTIDPFTSPTTATSLGLTGTCADDAEQVRVYVDGILSATAVPTGTTWAATVSGLTSGAHSITAKAANSLGSSHPSAVRILVVTVSPPASPTLSAISSPTWTMPIPVSGTCPATATQVQVLVDGVQAATAVPSGTSWSTNLPSVAVGTHSVTATASNAAGTSLPSSARTVVVTAGDVIPPAPPIILAPANADATAPVSVTGTAEALSTVTLREGASVLGTVAADSGGAWSLSVTLAAGTHTLNATATDAAGNVSSPSSPFAVNAFSAPVSITSPAEWETAALDLTVSGTNGMPGVPVVVRLSGTVLGTSGPADGAGAWSVGVTATPGIIAITAEPQGFPGLISPARHFTADATIVSASAEGAQLMQLLAKSKARSGLTYDAGTGLTWLIGNWGFPGIWVPVPQDATEWLSFWTAFKGMVGQAPYSATGCGWFAKLIPWAWSRATTGSEPFTAANMVWGTGTARGNAEACGIMYAGWAAQMARWHPDLWATDVHYFEDWLNAFPIDGATGAVAIPVSAGSIIYGGATGYAGTGDYDDWDMMAGATLPVRSLADTVGLAILCKGLRDAASALPTPDTTRAALYDAKLQAFVAAIASFKHKTGGTWDTSVCSATGGQWTGGTWDGRYYLSSNAHEPLATGASSGHMVSENAVLANIAAYQLASSADLDAISDALATSYQSSDGNFYRGSFRMIAWPYWHTVLDNTTVTKRYHVNGSYWPVYGAVAAAINRKHRAVVGSLFQDIVTEALRQRRVGGEFWESFDNPTVNDRRPDGKYHGYENIALSLPVQGVESGAAYIDVVHPGDGSDVYLTFPNGHRVWQIEIITPVEGSVHVWGAPLLNTDGEAYPSPVNYGPETLVATLTMNGTPNVVTPPGSIQPAGVWGGRYRINATGVAQQGGTGSMRIRFHQGPPTVSMISNAAPPSPPVSVTDPANSSALGSYAQVFGVTGTFAWNASGFYRNSTGNAAYVRNTTDFADGAIQLRINTQNAAYRTAGLLIRQSGLARLQLNITPTHADLFQMDASGTVVNNWIWALTHTDGVWYTWKIEVLGSSVRVYRDGVLIGTAVTTLTSAGKAGFVGNNVNGTWNVDVDDVVIQSAQPQPIPPGHYLIGWNGSGPSPAPLLFGGIPDTSAFTGTSWELRDANGNVVVTGPAGSWPRY